MGNLSRYSVDEGNIALGDVSVGRDDSVDGLGLRRGRQRIEAESRTDARR